MGDPLSITASMIAVLQLTGTILSYLKVVKGGSDDRKRILEETFIIQTFLSILQTKAESPNCHEEWNQTLKSLVAENGPIDQFNLTLERLKSKLQPPGRFGKAMQVMKWPFQKQDVNEILSMLARQKSLFILAVQNDHMALAEKTHDDVKELAGKVADLQLGQKRQEAQRIIDWLSPLNFATVQNDVFATRVEGTGEWLLDNNQFKGWLNGANKILWCPGIPGSGKTILASIIINHLQRTFGKENDVGLAYLYCNYKEVNQTSINLIASLLQQLVQADPEISEEIKRLYENHLMKRTCPSLAEYSSLLQSKARHYSRLFIVIDALDECTEYNRTREILLNEINKLQPVLHLVVTARPNITIVKEVFLDAATLEIHPNDQDIETYIDDRMETERILRNHINKDQGLRCKIIETLTQNVKGMFLLARLHINSLAKKRTRKDVHRTLANLPKELDDTYDEAMKRISSQEKDDIELAHHILSWISYAQRPLAVQELQYALAVTFNKSDTEEDNMTNEDLGDENLMDENSLISVCAGLVTIDEQSNIVRLVHYTTEQYFQRFRDTQFPNAQSMITKCCITYLSLMNNPAPSLFAGMEIYDQCKVGINDLLRNNPLLGYACQYWGKHARCCGDSKTIQNSTLQFLALEPQALLSFQIRQFLEQSNQEILRNCPRMCVVASFGLVEIIVLLIEGHAEVDRVDSTAIHCPVTRVEIADIMTPDSVGRTPLHWAAWRGHGDVVELLVEKYGAKTGVRDERGWTALHGAARYGHKDVVALLLDKGADIGAKTAIGDAALIFAVAQGHRDVVLLLLDRGADVAATAEDGWTALHAAMGVGHKDMVVLLLDKGADVAATNKDGWTALHGAARWGHKDVVALLLDKGADVAATQNDGRTALHEAARGGHKDVVLFLLDRGADVRATDSQQETALHGAASGGHKDIVALLEEALENESRMTGNANRVISHDKGITYM